MKIVIDIPEETYHKIKTGLYDYGDMNIIIKNGTPLPKNHGRLIDADELKITMEKDIRKALSFVDLTDFVWLAPTIIKESDSE